jgi:hypothetical protein
MVGMGLTNAIKAFYTTDGTDFTDGIGLATLHYQCYPYDS